MSVGVSAAAICAAQVPDAQVATAAGGVLAGTISDIGIGVLGSVFYDGLKAGFEDIAERFSSSSKNTPRPADRAFARGVRRSQLTAARYLIDQHLLEAKADPQSFDVPLIEKFGHQARRWVRAELSLCDDPNFLDSLPIDEAAEDIEAVIAEASPTSIGRTYRRLQDVEAASFLEELTKAASRNGGSLPDSFLPWYKGEETRVGWVQTARSYFTEQVTHDEELKTVVFLRHFDQLNVKLETALVSLDYLVRAARSRDEALIREVRDLSRVVRRAIFVNHQGRAFSPDREAKSKTDSNSTAWVDRTWLQRIYTREISSMLNRYRAVFDHSQCVQMTVRELADPGFVDLFPGVHRLQLTGGVSQQGAKRLSRDDITLAKDTVAKHGGLRLVISPAHAGTLALATFLQSHERAAVSFDFQRAHSVEIMEHAARNMISADGFTLTIATAAELQRRDIKRYHPMMMMPGMSHGILSSPGTSAHSLAGKYILMRDTPSTEALILHAMLRSKSVPSAVIREGQPHEATRALRSGDAEVRAIIGFPHYEFNTNYNSCVLVPYSPDEWLPVRPIFLYLRADLSRQADLHRAIELLFRHAWQTLLDEPQALRDVVDLLISNVSYVATLIRITGIRTGLLGESGQDLLMSPRFLFRECKAEEIVPLRVKVLRGRQWKSELRFENDNDPESAHFCTVDRQSQIVGCVSFLPSEWNDRLAWQLRGMAVAENLQFQRVGTDMLSFALGKLRDSETERRVVWGNARQSSAPFFAKLGWRVASEVFHKKDVGPSVKMVRDL